MREVDLFVIGGGSGGVRAARVAAQHGASVALAEEYRVGGTCVIRGCVPKKLMVLASRFAQAFDDSAGFGWTLPAAPAFAWPALMRRVHAEVTRLEAAYTAGLQRAGVALHTELSGSVKLLTDTLAMTDPIAFGRAQQLRDSMRGFAQHFKIAQTWDLELAAMLAPIGYLALPAMVLQRSREGGNLSGPEKDMLARVPETGANLLDNIPRLETVANIVRYQQKNFDGSGHPADALAGDEIPIGARILKVLNDLLIVESKKVPRFKALESLRHCPGRYDPLVLEAVAASFDLALQSGAGDNAAPIGVTLRELRTGHELASGIETKDGTLVVSAGTTISQMHLQKVRNFAELSGIQEPIYIKIEKVPIAAAA